MPPLRPVLDTNLLVSALVFRSPAMNWLRPAWQAGDFVPVVSRETIAELERVLRYPRFHLSADDLPNLLADYLPWCERVTVATPPVVPDCRDPGDRPFLALALVAGADCLVTGDADLLVLAPQFAIPIIKPAAFRLRLYAAG